MLSIGLMSGTSMDGIDAALLETDGRAQINPLGFYHLPYELSFKRLLKTAEWAIRQAEGDLQQAAASYHSGIEAYLSQALGMAPAAIQSCRADMQTYLKIPLSLEAIIQHSTELHAKAARQLLAQTGYEAAKIAVVGYHGQAMYHQPVRQISVMVGDGQALANQLDIPVVNDFRRADIMSGGQGAPFAPLYHLALVLPDQPIPCVVVNCGGIANITLIQSADPKDLIALDTGPGNALIDQLVRQRTQGLENMDKDGHFGAKGKMDPGLLKALYDRSVLQAGQSYFLKPAPKSLDSGDMHLIPELVSFSVEDACATLEYFTAETIVGSVKALGLGIPQHWILAGGGWNNPVICSAIRACVNRERGQAAVIRYADELGWHSQSLEAEMFGYYAVCCLQGIPISFPGTTGVGRPTCGGSLYQPQRI